MKKELMTLRIFKKIKESAKNLVEEEEKEEQEKQRVKRSTANHAGDQHLLRSMRDYKKLMYYTDNYNGDFHQKANIGMLNDIIKNNNKDNETEVCPYDPMKNLTSENFLYIKKKEMQTLIELRKSIKR